ncbi:survival motor neuron protein [Nilaparvata lugens]|uniref:survival motor neuron protein n=1 Tax=Nilaparvata lugens TaxID=108931 RepID=UPI00193E1FD8|nr:survival motor neuron protein [Nilaparvata lugens]
MKNLFVRNSNEMNNAVTREVDIYNDYTPVDMFERAVSNDKDKIKVKYNTGSQNVRSKNNNMSWKKGDFCRAIYTDGLEYEAEILEISKNKCVIKYFGYGDEQTLYINDLLESHGEEARQEQSKIASNSEEYLNDDMEIAEPLRIGLQAVPPPGQTVYPPQQQQVHPPPGQSFHPPPGQSFYPPPGQSFHPPQQQPFHPPPGDPPSGLPGFLPRYPPPPPPHVLSNCGVDESEAMSEMLMSWYMNGFHTGYYEGLTSWKKSGRK